MANVQEDEGGDCEGRGLGSDREGKGRHIRVKAKCTLSAPVQEQLGGAGQPGAWIAWGRRESALPFALRCVRTLFTYPAFSLLSRIHPQHKQHLSSGLLFQLHPSAV